MLVGDLLHPINDLAVEIFLGRDVGHGGGGSRAMPMLLARRKPDDVARTDFLNRATFALRASATGSDDQCLSERMRMPGGAGARLERDGGRCGAARFIRLK